MLYRNPSTLRSLLLSLTFALSSWASAWADVPTQMTVQGKLTDASGTPQVGSYAVVDAFVFAGEMPITLAMTRLTSAGV